MEKAILSGGKKVAALLLAALLAFSMFGCGGDEDTSDQVIGTWALDYDMGPMISEEMGVEYAGFQSPLEVSIRFDFDEDGNYRMYVDEDLFRTNFNNWMTAFAGYMSEELYQQIEAEGVDRATADQMIQETYGCTAQEYMTQLLQQSIDVDSLLDEIESTGAYEARGEKLFMADPGEEISANQYDLFKVDGDTLTLSLADDSQDPEVLPGLDYPLVFTRQQ